VASVTRCGGAGDISGMAQGGQSQVQVLHGRGGARQVLHVCHVHVTTESRCRVALLPSSSSCDRPSPTRQPKCHLTGSHDGDEMLRRRLRSRHSTATRAGRHCDAYNKALLAPCTMLNVKVPVSVCVSVSVSVSVCLCPCLCLCEAAMLWCGPTMVRLSKFRAAAN
jgi:hypothetical protein